MSATRPDSLSSVSWIEHQMLDHIKGALRVTLDWDAPSVSLARKKSSVKFSLQSFCRHLERLIAIEEEDGYLEAVAESKPNLEPRIRRLRKDHERFRQWVCELAPRIEDVQDWQEDEFRAACDDVRALLHEVDEHDHKEVALLQETLILDEGGEG